MLVQKTHQILIETCQQLKYQIPSKFLVWIDLKSNHQTDVCSNLVMIIASQTKKQPAVIAKRIIKQINFANHNLTSVKYQDGYLNFKFTIDFRNSIINKILKNGANFGRIDLGQQKTVNYEWISANPTGYLHIGHARNAILGMAISNILEFVNYKVYREFYINDQGKQIYNLAKSIYYAYCKQLKQPIAHQDDEIYVNAEIDQAAKQLVTNVDTRYLQKDFFKNKTLQTTFMTFGKQFFLPKIKALCESLNIRFDRWFKESELFTNNYEKRFLHKLKLKDLLYKKDGALWFKIDGENDFVLIKSNGEATYFFGDLMYHANKFDRKFDYCIDLWGADHHAHYLKIQKALKVLNYPAENYYVNLMQMVKIVRGKETLKMSKRQGTAFYIHDLLKEVGNDFMKFMLLSSKRNNKFTFNLDLIKQRTLKNPLFYCQYAYARACQLIIKHKHLIKSNLLLDQYYLLDTLTEQKLILSLNDFTNHIQKAAQNFEPYVLIEYVQYLCRTFNGFYENNRVNSAIDNDLKIQRLALTKAFCQVFVNIFNLFKISTPEKM